MKVLLKSVYLKKNVLIYIHDSSPYSYWLDKACVILR